jgi:hypothetical protein
MVEENEIRAGMSFYERARLAAEAAKLGIYPDPAAAIAALFASASPAKRSKIGSFVRVHEALGDALRYPTAIPERLGLALAAASTGTRCAGTSSFGWPTGGRAPPGTVEKSGYVDTVFSHAKTLSADGIARGFLIPAASRCGRMRGGAGDHGVEQQCP